MLTVTRTNFSTKKTKALDSLRVLQERARKAGGLGAIYMKFHVDKNSLSGTAILETRFNAYTVSGYGWELSKWLNRWGFLSIEELVEYAPAKFKKPLFDYLATCAKDRLTSKLKYLKKKKANNGTV